VSIPVIASGGAGEPRHLLDALTKGKADAALAASIFHFGQYSVKQVKQYLKANGVPVRL
jgi:cyclase